MTRLVSPLGLLLCTLLAAAPFAAAAPRTSTEKAASGSAANADKDKPYQEWKKVLKDAEVQKGIFTLYQKRENLYLELRPDQLDRPVLGIFSLARGIGAHRLLGGMPTFGDRLVEFHRAGDRILVMARNTQFIAPAGTAYEKAVALSHGHSVLASLKIESVHDSSQAVLVDFAPFLVSDVTDLAEGMRQALGGKAVRFDKDRSALGSVKAFPENLEIEALLTYSPNDRMGIDLSTVPDERYIPVTMHYSFSKLSEVPMMPRLADDRTGYFLTAVKDFSRDRQEHFWLRYAEHWRLEKKDPGAALSEPVKPIVYYIDHTVPQKFRPYIRQGVERWQKAFEAAGFKNAILARDAPDDPNWDPEDVRYSTIRWITSSAPSFGAIGPSRVDPRTGEILDADILIEASIVQRRWKIYRDLMGPTSIARGVVPWLDEAPAGPAPERRCDLQAGIGGGAALAALAMMLDGAAADSSVWDRFVGDMLIHTTLHEVGHTLGLTHNFRSSTATPVDKLNDRDWTGVNGLTASVMDYATPNIAADRARQGEYYGAHTGTADVWMIRYAYTPSGAVDLESDYAFAREIADESTRPGHEYSNDTDTNAPDALDPRALMFDLGDDPLRFARERTALVAGMWKNDQLEARILGAEGEYPVLRRAMDGLLEQYGIALGLAVKYVGGQYQSRNHRGQPGATDPLMPVPAARQREALDFLAERAFGANAFAVSPTLLNRLAPNRWLHWGVNDNFGVGTGPRVDYNLNDKAFAIQNALLTGLLDPHLLARLREAESRTAQPFRLSEHFDRLTRMLWNEAGGVAPTKFGALEGTGTRRDVQRAYVDKLATLVVNPPAGTPDDARALARLQLTRLDGRAARVLAGEAPLGDYARAHLLEARARIKRALEAGRDAEGSGSRGPGGPSGQP